MRLYVREFDGPADRTVLVVHGGPDWDHSYLVEPLKTLAGEHRLLFPDLRGCGRSPVADPLTPDAIVGDLVELIGASRVDVLGFSYGGLIAQRLAVQAPHLVRRLIIASSSVLPVPSDAFDGWEEYERRRAAHPSVWDTSPLEGAELTRAEALATAPLHVWRLKQVRFTGTYLRAWREGRCWKRRGTWRTSISRRPGWPRSRGSSPPPCDPAVSREDCRQDGHRARPSYAPLRP
ncbi:alpha/beta fold hydrolase [Nonomuraea sp. NPDC050328]|uniref:alpha/beta fold hydrolase n=1 Tax=Nonomuraea sp. NPDC050328 TaxID=3364361 RepID=UPI00379FCBFB